MATAETDVERRARMDKRMDESLGDFDDMIRKERERLARERDANAKDPEDGGDESGSGPDGTSGGTGPGGDMKSSESSSGEEARTGDGDMQSQKGGNTSGGGSSNTKSLPTPANVPSGDDDDIIARQIREAAEKETDPELREKLWQEYIEYKRNAKK